VTLQRRGACTAFQHLPACLTVLGHETNKLPQVQSGGSFDVDYSVIGPGDRQILSGEKERQGDYVFTAQSTGSYSFCFSNTMSTFADKYVDFEITSEANPGTSSALLPQKSGAPAEQHDQLEDLVFKVSGQLSTVNRMQKYFRTRENRNFSTVRSTEKRIFQFSLIEVIMMVGMAVLQVLVVRFFFQGARKGECFANAFRPVNWYLCADADAQQVTFDYSIFCVRAHSKTKKWQPSYPTRLHAGMITNTEDLHSAEANALKLSEPTANTDSDDY
jgi:hypothetical protein